MRRSARSRRVPKLIMESWQITGSFGLDNLKRVTLDDPKGDVVVRLRAASLNYRDLMMVRGHYNPKQPLPLTPCSDGAGEVISVAPHVTSVKPGDRVMTVFAPYWTSGPATADKIKRTLGGPLQGTLSTHIALPESGVLPLPDKYTFEEGATFPCAAVTAWSALVEHGRLTPGQRVLLLGSGGVSTFAHQIAKMCGATTIMVTSKPEAAKKLGVDEVIDRNAHPDWEKLARGSDHVVEVGGAGTLTKSIKSVVPGGSVYIIGVLAGTAEQVSVVPVLMQNIRLQGVFVGHREAAQAMMRAFVASDVRPHVDKVFAFDQASEAFSYLEKGGHVGKVVIAID
jgi:NADPH:quinone reductase-like Zn-dependent oxidoreductase